MKILLLTLSTIAVLAGICYAIVWLICWFSETHDSYYYVEIDFKHFKALYEIAPDKYILNKYYVGYSGDTLMMSKTYTVQLRFSVIDTIKYQAWRFRVKRDYRMQMSKTYTVQFLKMAQKDIDQYMKKNNVAK